MTTWSKVFSDVLFVLFCLLLLLVVVVLPLLPLNESYIDDRGHFNFNFSKIHKGCIPNPECIWPSLGMVYCRHP